MSASTLAATLTGLLLLWRLVLDYVRMYPLNDLSRKSVRSRRRDWSVHYAPLCLAFLLSLSQNKLPVALALVIVLLYAAIQVVSWWLPYVKGGTDEQKSRWDQLYGKTHRFLPRISNHTIPDTSQVITGLLTVLVVIGMAGYLWTASGSAEEAVSAQPQPSPSPSGSQSTQKAIVQTAFTQAGQKPEELLISLFQNAVVSLDIAINAINHEKIVNSIVDARIRGVQIRIITDRSESSNAVQSERLKTLLAAGITVKENSRKGLMDLKLSIIDGQVGTTGSFNYTENAATINDEMLVVVRDAAAVAEWKSQFEAMWNDQENFKELKTGIVK
ncbi:MAG: hypothetical protein K0R57_5112 [Paenibacillaceae bacterium]|jgi:phosphatidylserine/phosphatidylglycerophosphate/cardiolipin synthase-like enzyme|nr:hypothetical protein [Paenibacillaceae bacterium]